MKPIIDIFSDVKARVGAYWNPWTDEYKGDYPEPSFTPKGKLKPKEAEKAASFVEGLFKDAKNYFEQEFERTKNYRFNTGKAGLYWDQNLMLEGGEHWQVWGRRNAEEKDDWKQELTDPLTGYNLRTRVSYLTANWHNVQVTPNIADVDAVLDQDRKATRWTERTTDIVKFMGIFGEAWTISFLNRNHPYEGVADEYLCRPGSLLLSPGAKSKAKEDQCWYAAHVDMVTGQWIRETYPNFDLSKAAPMRSDVLSYALSDTKQSKTDFSHTKYYDKVEVWMDDPALDSVPFDQEEFDQRFGLLAETLQGVKQEPVPGFEQERVVPQSTDNHPKWIKAYLDVLEERVGFAARLSAEGKTTEQDEILLNELSRLVYEQIEAHEKLAAKTPYQGAKTPRYPFGRHLVKIGGEIAMDQPFEYEADWRKFIHKVYNEKVPMRLDGRSDVEIQRPTQLAIDTFISRFADHMLLNALKKPYFPLAEKANIEKNGFDNHPLKPGYTSTGDPPKYPNTQEPDGYLKMIQLFKGFAERNTGINEVAFGKSAPQESGRKVDSLLQQTEMIVTGEANQNLKAYVEEVIEARLLIMRQFYVTPRPYTIGGRQVLVSVANKLRNVPVENLETGGVEVIHYPQFEISVRPDSNAPYRWERELNQLTQIMGLMPPEYQAAFFEMLIKLLSERYPDLGPGGKFSQMNEDAALGEEIRGRREEIQNERKAILENAAKKRARKEADEYLARSSGNGNGKAEAA